MRIACVLDEWFQREEFERPYRAFLDAGHQVTIVGKKGGVEVQDERRSGQPVRIEKGIDEVSPDQFDALFIPGGYSPDRLRADPAVVQFVKAFFTANKPVFAICHGPQLILAAEEMAGRTMTAWKTVQHDLKLAGANVVDQEVVVDRNLVTSRQPADLDAFIRESLQQLAAAPAPSGD